MNPQINAAQRLCNRQLIPPTNPVAGTVNGAAVDIHQLTGGGSDYGSGRVHLVTGLDTGTPSARSVAVTIQDSADGSTGWANVLDENGAAYTLTISAVSTENSFPVNLRKCKRFIRAVAVTAFTAGTAPTLYQSVGIVLSGSNVDPQSATD
jgi:hypothetical protein